MEDRGVRENRLSRSDFLLQDIVISVSRGAGGGGVFLPADTEETPPTPISPIASVLVNIDYVTLVREVIADALRNKGDFTAIGRAFREGDPDGNPAIATAIHEIGKAVVASAAFAELAGRSGGEVGLIDPNCGGTSYETIPTSITPVVHYGREIHRVTALTRIREQLQVAVQAFDKAATAAQPSGADAKTLHAELEGAFHTAHA